MFKVLKGKIHKHRILCAEKITFRNKDDIKTSSDEEKLREFIVSRPILKE